MGNFTTTYGPLVLPWLIPLGFLILSYGLAHTLCALLRRARLSGEATLRRPLTLVLFLALCLVARNYLPPLGELGDFIFRGTGVALSVILPLIAYRLVDILFILADRRAKRSKNKIDDILVPLFRKCAKVAVVVLGLLFVGDALGLDMKNLLAGLGIGGLAFAFAAKDTIANLFGSVMVILDRPFGVGDWVKIDRDLEGTVEEVGIRSTRIRTFYDSLISVPNGRLAHAHIDNFGQRKYRRLSTKIAIEYSTPPEKIEAFCEGIRQIIATHRWTRKNYFHVYLNELGSSSLDILLYVFWEVPGWSKELAERHRLLLDILRLGRELGVGFAFPTQTLHVFNEETSGDGEDAHLPRGHHLMGKEKAERVLQRPLTFKNERSALKDGDLPEDDISL